MPASFGDQVAARKEHDCPVCHQYITEGTIVSPVAYDAVLQRSLAPGKVWGHLPCAEVHGKLTGRAPVYSTGRERLEEHQNCSRCSIDMAPGSVAVRNLDQASLTYRRLCQVCAGITVAGARPNAEQALLSAISRQLGDGVTEFKFAKAQGGMVLLTFELLMPQGDESARLAQLVLGLEQWKEPLDLQ